MTFTSKKIGIAVCAMALQLMLSSCKSIDSTPEASAPMSHHVKESPYCAASMGEGETEQVKLHELKPDTPPFVLKGGFHQPGPLVFVGSFPPDTKFPAHYHGADEELIVMSGSIYIGGMDGRPMALSNATLYRKGDKHLLPVNTVHWVITTDTYGVYKICTEGPFKITFVDQKPEK